MPSVPNFNGQTETTTNPVHCCLSHSRFFGDCGFVTVRGQTGLTCIQISPPGHATAGVNDELIHFPNTFGTSYRFADLQSTTVNCHFLETYGTGNPLYDWGNARLRAISHGSLRRGSEEWGLTTDCKFFGTVGVCSLRGASC